MLEFGLRVSFEMILQTNRNKNASKPSPPNVLIGGLPLGFPLKACGNDGLVAELERTTFEPGGSAPELTISPYSAMAGDQQTKVA
jgi:hypothetical protein